MTDSDNSIESTEEPQGFRFSAGLLWRIVAVGLFVALGTFAVVQSLGSSKDADSHSDHDHAESDLDGENSTDDMLATGATNGAASTSLALQSAFPDATTLANGELNQTTTQKDFGLTEGLGRLAKVSLKHVKKKQLAPILTAGYQSSAKTVTPPSQFSSNTQSPSSLRRTMSPGPKVDSSFGMKPKTNPVVAAKPATQESFKANLSPKPPTGRLAQLGDGPGGVSTGFQANPATRPPVRPMTTASPFQNATALAKEGLGGLKSSAAQKTSDMLESAKQSAANATSAMQSGASRLGNAMRPVEAKIPPVNASTSNPYSLKSQDPRNATRGATGSPFQSGGNSASAAPSTMRPISKANSGPATGPTGSSGSPFSRAGFSSQESQNSLATQRTQPRPSALQPQQRNNVPAELPRARANATSSPFSATRSGMGSRINEPPKNPVTRQASTTLGSAPVASVAARNTPGDRAFEGVQAPSLTVEKVSPREIQVMQTADFEIIVKNVGRVVADEVRVLDKVPAGTQYIGATPEPTSLNRSGDLQWSLGTMRPGQEKRVRYQLKPTQPGEIGSVAQVVFATRASMRTTVTKPVLEIRHTTEPRVMIGDNVVFDVVVENKGDGPANRVIIQEKVPGNLEFSDGSPEIEYEIGTLMPGQSRRIQLGLKAAKVGKLRNVMFASAKGGLKAQHELDLEIVAPDLRTKSEGPTRRFIQRQATHRFTIENAGTAKAKNVELFARLPSGLRFVSANNRGKYDSSTHSVVWVMPELAQGVAGTVELTTMPVEAGEQNIKFESFADLGLKSETKQQLSVEHLIDVFFDIDDVVDPIEIGAGTSYRIRVVNQGTKTATGVQIQVVFPPGLQPTDVDGNLRNQIQGQRVIFEPISTMRPGDELGVTVRAVGKSQGDHRVVVNMRTDGRDTPVSKEETTRVYSDR